ncbi:MAG: tryptophan 2,3-dioxygenase family protein [Gemmatimonadota bacterium]|nr:tryptophan 2,3-dioxygenase family protein [Gemmatimonadota bacterium]
MPLTYASYLHLADLLDLQEPQSSPAEHDEMLFIVIHQTYELWFKQLLHETAKVQRDFRANELYAALHTFKRMRTIMKTLVAQIDVLETMTPRSFDSFRARLDTASGFQSGQYREMEFLFGYKRPSVLAAIPESGGARAAAEARLEDRTLVDDFYLFLGQRGLKVPLALLERDVREAIAPSVELQAEIYTAYDAQPNLALLFELMMDFDEGLQEWRYRHVKLVERTIGAKHGTGGSAGIEFLKQSVFVQLFPDLWAVRHRM